MTDKENERPNTRKHTKKNSEYTKPKKSVILKRTKKQRTKTEDEQRIYKTHEIVHIKKNTEKYREMDWTRDENIYTKQKKTSILLQLNDEIQGRGEPC